MWVLSVRRAASLAIVVAAPAAAQSAGVESEVARRSSVSLSFIQGRPQGAFARYVALGYGLDGAYLLRLDRAGIFSVRASVGALSYGSESRESALSESVGGRVQVQVTTSNYIVPMSIGPQVSWPRGPVRPYAHAGVGGQLLFSESRVHGTTVGTVLASTTNHSASAAAWSLGGGVSMPLVAGRTQVQLDLGVQYVGGRSARYLTKGSIVDLPGAQIAVTPRQSSTHMAIIRLGARVQP
jgi:hypothetical protein